MVIRSLCILAVVLGLSTNAFAGEHPILHRMSCTMVRYYVALYSAAAAENMLEARERPTLRSRWHDIALNLTPHRWRGPRGSSTAP
jgi:hypothetical protein